MVMRQPYKLWELDMLPFAWERGEGIVQIPLYTRITETERDIVSLIRFQLRIWRFEEAQMSTNRLSLRIGVSCGQSIPSNKDLEGPKSQRKKGGISQRWLLDNYIRERKHININKFAGLSLDWVGGKNCFCVQSFLIGENTSTKSPPQKKQIPRQYRDIFVYVFFFLYVFFCSQLYHRQQIVTVHKLFGDNLNYGLQLQFWPCPE